jgi:hypothetical protein
LCPNKGLAIQPALPSFPTQLLEQVFGKITQMSSHFHHPHTQVMETQHNTTIYTGQQNASTMRMKAAGSREIIVKFEHCKGVERNPDSIVDRD